MCWGVFDSQTASCSCFCSGGGWWLLICLLQLWFITGLNYGYIIQHQNSCRTFFISLEEAIFFLKTNINVLNICSNKNYIYFRFRYYKCFSSDIFNWVSGSAYLNHPGSTSDPISTHPTLTFSPDPTFSLHHFLCSTDDLLSVSWFRFFSRSSSAPRPPQPFPLLPVLRNPHLWQQLDK